MGMIPADVGINCQNERNEVMQTALRIEATVLPGNRVEISAPELLVGATVEVIPQDASAQAVAFQNACGGR